MLKQISPQLKQALLALKEGKFILLHDSENRENEIDMVMAAEHVDANAISSLRNNAGGLICAALENSFAKNMGLNLLDDAKTFAKTNNMLILDASERVWLKDWFSWSS
jgi:3,4-dihydroxy 2-butanone 4-phosphate synthase